MTITDHDTSTLPPAAGLDEQLEWCLGLLRAGLDGLLELGDRSDLLALGPDRLIGVLRGFEAHRSALAAVDAVLIEAADVEAIPERVAAPNLRAALAKILKITPATAGARIRLAEQTRPRQELSGGPLQPSRPVLAAAVRAGTISGDQALVISRAVDKLATNTAVSSDDVALAEQTLVHYSASLTPAELVQAARVIDDCLLPDGSLPNEQTTRARRGLHIGDEQRDGTHPITGHLTRELAAKLRTVLSPLARPRPSTTDGPDPRTADQRQHDALEDATDRLLASDTLPFTGGARTTLNITITLEQLRAAITGGEAPSLANGDQVDRSFGPFVGRFLPRTAATTSLGVRLSTRELLAVAEQALIVPVFLNNTGGIVSYGRVRRCASPGQIKALIARDKGCSFPGCDIPPEWCQVHHITEWWREGHTDINNLTLVCGYHHREFQQRGWQSRITEHGIPIWIPPDWIDPERRPHTNTRITGLNPALPPADGNDINPAPARSGNPAAGAPPPARASSRDPGPGGLTPTDPEILDSLDDLTMSRVK